ncbi:MAG: hypothetical protein ACMG6H_17620 [Acidobacteriota bacterium]
MSTKQIALPFRAKRTRQEINPNVDLVGRSYEEDYSTVTVVGPCPTDHRRVMVRRDPDGRVWSMPVWLMRLIFLEKKRKRAA